MAVNPRIPVVGRPLADLQALVTVCEQLRQGMESLGGTRGNPLDRAVTLNDLIALGLVSEATVKTRLK
jgi:hypothetical protein